MRTELELPELGGLSQPVAAHDRRPLGAQLPLLLRPERLEDVQRPLLLRARSRTQLEVSYNAVRGH